MRDKKKGWIKIKNGSARQDPIVSRSRSLWTVWEAATAPEAET